MATTHNVDKRLSADITRSMDATERAMGVELQLEELVEQRKRALVQGRADDARSLGREIAALQDELAALSELVPNETAPAATWM